MVLTFKEDKERERLVKYKHFNFERGRAIIYSEIKVFVHDTGFKELVFWTVRTIV